MEIKGKLIKKLNQEAGQSKAGKPYVKQVCIVETDAKYNPHVAIQCFGEDKIKQMNKLEIGMIVQISCNIYSKEFNGKYYKYIDGYWFADQTNNPDVNKGQFVTPDDNEDIPF